MMRKFTTAKLVSLLAGFTLLIGVAFIVPARFARAACGGATYGSGHTTLSVNIPQADTYKVWLRVLPSGANNSFNVEVDGGTCMNVTTSGSSWTWAMASPTTTFSTTGNHTLKLIGTQPQVGVDRVILLKNSNACTPDNTLNATTKPGDNCLVSSGTGDGGANGGGGTIVIASDGRKILVAGSRPISSGNLVLDPTIVTDQSKIDKIAKVEYYANGKLIQTLTKPPYYFNSKLLKDGTYEITEKVYFKDGTTQVKSANITIANTPGAVPKESLTKKIIIVVLLSVGVIVAGITGLLIFHPESRQWFKTIWQKILTLVGKLRFFKRGKF